MKIDIIERKSIFDNTRNGFYLRVPDTVKCKGYYESREFESYGEAQVAAGILDIIYEETLDYSEYEFILKATLRIIKSTWQ